MIDLIGKSWCAFGLKGTGKSTLANKILNMYGEKAIYYDTLFEAPETAKFDIYRPKDRYNIEEFEAVLRAIIPQNINEIPKYRLVVIDETNRFAPSKPAAIPRALADLNDQTRHYLMSAGYIARKPSQLNNDLTELSDYLFIFRLTGKNDIIYLNATVTGLGDAVASLGRYEFIVVNPDRSFYVSEPIEPDKEWVENARKLIDR